MKILFFFLTGWIFGSVAFGAPLEEPRLHGDWVMDVERTEAYLRQHRILNDPALERMRPILAGLKLRFDGTRVCKIDAEGVVEGCSDFAITAVTATKTIITSRGTDGVLVTSTLTWEKDGYWQETSMFPRYREKLIRPTNADQPLSQTSGAVASQHR